MKNLIIIIGAIIIALILVNFQCNDNIVDPPPGHPPGYQQDISWPSLADSPWPIYRSNPQGTGRSNYEGPLTGNIDWQFPSSYLQTGVTISNDSTIYFAPSGNPQGLFAVSIDGTLKWHLSFQGSIVEVQTTPLVASDGTIYVCSGPSGKFYAVNSNGSIKWIYDIYNSSWNKGMNIGLDGTLYFVDSGMSLNALGKDGTLLWKLNNPGFNYSANVSLTFSPDGKTLYVPGSNPSIFAVDVSSKNVKWTFGNSSMNRGAVVDSYGHIYILCTSDTLNAGEPSLFALNPDGSVRWSFLHNNSDLNAYCLDPTIDKNGNLYFAYDTLYSVDYQGIPGWKLPLDGVCESSLINDSKHNIYVTITGGSSSGKLLKVSNDGNIIWDITFNHPDMFPFSPSIGKNGRLFLPIWRGQSIYSIK